MCFSASHSADSSVLSTGVKSHETATKLCKLISLLLLEERFTGTKEEIFTSHTSNLQNKATVFQSISNPSLNKENSRLSTCMSMVIHKENLGGAMCVPLYFKTTLNRKLESQILFLGHIEICMRS